MKLISVKSAAGVSSVVLCVAASLALFAQDTPAKAPDVEYTATGTFSTPQVSGQDVFQLAGNAFAMSVVANAATVPTTHGAKWATYTKLTMSGAVSSALFPTPFAISSSNTSIELAMGNPSYDVFALFSPITVLGKPIYITTVLQMPTGTLTTPLIKPFTAPVTLSPSSGTVTYTDPSTGDATTLTIASGSLSTTLK